MLDHVCVMAVYNEKIKQTNCLNFIQRYKTLCTKKKKKKSSLPLVVLCFGSRFCAYKMKTTKDLKLFLKIH